MSSTEKETKTNNKKVVKKGMGAFRLSVEILDNLTKCLGKERVVEIVKAELEKSLSKFKSLD